MADITKPVNWKVNYLKLERDGYVMKASFKVPSYMTEADSPSRATWIDHEVRIDREGGQRLTGVYVNGQGGSSGAGQSIFYTDADRFWIGGQETNSSVEKNFDRTRYYPCRPGQTCHKALWGAFGGNPKVGAGWGASMQGIGPVVWAEYKFLPPRKPTISWSYDKNESKATVTVKTDEGKDNYERYDTVYMVTVRKVDGTEATLRKWTASRATEIKATFDLSPYLKNMAAGKYVTIKCKAYARGMAGDNPAQANAVTASRSVYWPSAATLGTVKCSSKTNTGRITVPVTPGKSFAASTQLQLQRKHGESGNWEDVSGATDNGDCTALYDTYSDAAPVAGEYVYYRVKSTRDQFTQYSAAKRADCLFTAKPKVTCSATVGIVSVTPASGGTSATVVMGWTDSTSNTGWELSWSDNKGAWNSTEDPSTASDTNADATSKSKKYKNTKTLQVAGLTSGETYYCRVRRYRTVGSDTLYSAYSSIFSFTTESATDDRCGIISMSPSKTGTACTVVVGYTEDNANTGTELSWSTSSGAWSSNSIDPDTDTFETAGSDSSTKWKKQVSLTLSNLTSGTTYYVRARRYLTADGTTTYTPYSAIQSFKTESAADDTCGIISVSPSTSGSMATVLVGFNEDNNNTGTEISWSDFSGAWQSNVEPETMLATWGRGTHSGGDWSYHHTVYLRNLTPGKTYYVKARRYLEAGGNTTYTPWSKLHSFKTPKATAANDKCGIVSVTKHSDGLGANVIVGWTEDTENDGTELTWSTDKDAWTSNTQPSSLQATWSDNTRKSDDWMKTQTISLHDLERGETYYIRARRYLNDDDGTTYTPYAPMASITMPSERIDTDVRCGLVSVDAGEDGQSAVVVVGWSGDHTGCEVTWSKDPDAWESSEAPQSTQFDWKDETRKSEEWSNTSTLYLRGLEEGETYYVRARSYFDGSDGQTWSNYTDDMTVTPYSAPSSVTLFAPSAIARGDAIECYWAIGSEMEQVEWRIHRDGQPNRSLASGTGSLCHGSIQPAKYDGLDSISFYVSAGCGGGLTDSNMVSVGIADYPACEIWVDDTLTAQPASFEAYTSDPASRLLCTLRSNGVTLSAPDGDSDQIAGDAVWTSGLTPTWEAATWGDTALYNALDADVTSLTAAQEDAEDAFDATAEAAALESAESDEQDAKDAFDATDEAIALAALTPADEGYGDAYDAAWTTDEGIAYAAAITAREIAYETAYSTDEGLALIAANTALETAENALEAHPSDGECYITSISLPEGLPLVDGATYTLSAAAVEPVAGLTSETTDASFNVKWEHQAVAPKATVTPSASDRSAVVTLIPPNSAGEYDTCDVYRMELSGHVLVAEDIPLDGTVADPFAPFGKDADLHYRVCLRTADGDFEFADFPYTMNVGGTRFDWDGKHVELPYNVKVNEQYRKDFEARAHADGSVGGYYGNAVSMSGSIASDVVKVDAAQIQLVRELGEYAGAVFCRTASGLAFQCNADVSELGTSYNSGAIPVSIDLTKTSMTEQFKCNGGA